MRHPYRTRPPIRHPTARKGTEVKHSVLLDLGPLLLLLVAACWHAVAIGTQGLRGRIVHWLTGAGFLWGLITPPWGWVQIGGAVIIVTSVRWLVTPDGRVFLLVAGRVLVQLGDEVLRLLGRTLRWVLSPAEREAPPAEQCEQVSRPRDTLGSRMATTPPAHLFEPEPWKRGTAGGALPAASLAPVETYSDILGSVLAGRLGYNEAARYLKKTFNISRSKFARDMRALREDAA